jgi:hypothetical protein
LFLCLLSSVRRVLTSIILILPLLLLENRLNND